MRLADEVNRYIDHNKPWSMIKQEGLGGASSGVYRYSSILSKSW